MSLATYSSTPVIIFRMNDLRKKNISENSSLLNETEKERSDLKSYNEKPFDLIWFKKLKFIPGFSQFSGVKVCLIIGFLHRLFLYTTLTFLDNLSNVRENETLDNITNSTQEFSENSHITGILYLSLSYIIAPIPGILADKYFSRRRAILISLILCAVGATIESILHTLVDVYSLLSNVETTEKLSIYYAFHCFSIIAKIIGNSGVIALLVPFGVDQMEEAGEVHINSYFVWFYWVQNIGGIAVIGNYVIYYHKKQDLDLLIINSYISTGAIYLSIFIFLFALLFKLLQWNKPIGSPIRKIYRVVFNQVKNCISKRVNSNLGPVDNNTFLDFTSKIYKNGINDYYETVEDVKTFFRILFVLFIMIWYFGIFGLIETIYPSQGRHISCAENNFYAQCLVNLIDEFVIVMLIPILQFAKRKFNWIRFHKILYKFLLGLFAFTIAVYLAFAVDLVFYFHPFCNETATPIDDENFEDIIINILPLIPQSFLFGVSEVLAAIAAMEFVYAQSPNDMKGFVFGLMNMMIGLGTVYPIILNMLLSLIKDKPFFIYNLIIVVATTLHFLLFCVIAKSYTRRKRQPVEVWPK